MLSLLLDLVALLVACLLVGFIVFVVNVRLLDLFVARCCLFVLCLFALVLMIVVCSLIVWICFWIGW